MDLSIYSVEDVILTALKSEIEAQAAYTQLADGVENFILKERLNFLAQEEEKHKGLFDRLYRKKFPNKKLVVPEEESPVPLPEIKIDMESLPISEILEGAMEAEQAARDFYTSMAEKFEQPDIRRMLHWVASMELGHYLILEAERDNAKKFEDYDSQWPLMHIGP